MPKKKIEDQGLGDGDQRVEIFTPSILTVTCPLCGTILTPESHPDQPYRLIGYCNCTTARRAVIELDAPSSSAA